MCLSWSVGDAKILAFWRVHVLGSILDSGDSLAESRTGRL